MGRPPLGSEILATRRLTLVPLRIEDATEMAGVLSDIPLYSFTGGNPPTARELGARYRVQVAGRSPDGAETWCNWIVRTRDPDEAVGFVQATITDAGRVAEVAWLIGVPWQGRGFAVEAATAMVAWLEAQGVNRIKAHVRADHVASERVAARAGMALTGEIADGERVWARDGSQQGSGAGPGCEPDPA